MLQSASPAPAKMLACSILVALLMSTQYLCQQFVWEYWPVDEVLAGWLEVVRDRVIAYNGQLRAACTSYGRRCRYNDSAYRFRFDLTMLSAIDFFHPNASGQEALARETYPGSFTW